MINMVPVGSRKGDRGSSQDKKRGEENKFREASDAKPRGIDAVFD